MQCSTCGYTLPEGATFCTNCGAKIGNQGNAANQPVWSSQVEPTIAASSTYQSPQNPPLNPQNVPPTVYGAPYSTPQQYSSEAPPPPPPANMYGAPPQPNVYGTPYGQTPGSYVPQAQPPTPPARRKGPGVGLIIGIIVLVLVIVGGGLLAIRAFSSSSNNNTTNTVTPTATKAQVTVAPTSPTGAQIDPAAAAIITKAQTSTAIDSNFLPTNVTSNFAVGQKIYITFNLSTNGQSGFAEAKWYSGATLQGSKILTVQSNFDHGYFSDIFSQAATGTGELYWCTQSDCSDAKLATFVTFTVA